VAGGRTVTDGEASTGSSVAKAKNRGGGVQIWG